MKNGFLLILGESKNNDNNCREHNSFVKCLTQQDFVYNLKKKNATTERYGRSISAVVSIR